MSESNSFFYYFPVFSIFWQWICITLIIRGSIILLKVESQLSSFCVYVMGILIWPASFSPFPAPWHGPWSLTSIFVMSRTSSWKFFLARRERRYLKLEMLEKAFWRLSAHRCWLTLNYSHSHIHWVPWLCLCGMFKSHVCMQIPPASNGFSLLWPSSYAVQPCDNIQFSLFCGCDSRL